MYPGQERNEFGYTLLMLYIIKAEPIQLHVVEHLLQLPGDLNRRDHGGLTVLAHAINWRASLPVLLAISEKQPQPTRVPKSGLTMLGHYLSFNKRGDEHYKSAFVESLLRNGVTLTS